MDNYSEQLRWEKKAQLAEAVEEFFLRNPFNEKQHKRGPDGKFAPKSGGTPAKPPVKSEGKVLSKDDVAKAQKDLAAKIAKQEAELKGLNDEEKRLKGQPFSPARDKALGDLRDRRTSIQSNLVSNKREINAYEPKSEGKILSKGDMLKAHKELTTKINKQESDLKALDEEQKKVEARPRSQSKDRDNALADIRDRRIAITGNLDSNRREKKFYADALNLPKPNATPKPSPSGQRQKAL